MLRQLLRNVKYLAIHDIREDQQDVLYRAALATEDYLRFEYPASTEGLWAPEVLGYDKTLGLLEREPRSLVRLGDGEIELIEGRSIPFQEYDPALAACLREMVEGNRGDVYVGINYNYFHSTRDMPPYVRRFYLTYASRYRNWLLEHCNRQRPFWIAAAFNQLYMTLEDYDFDAHYRRLRALFGGRDVVVFIGANTHAKLKANVFDKASSLEWVDCASSNAYRDIDMILEKARSFPEGTLLAFCVGPASKAAVWELSKEGRLCWDLGHLPADYDAYVKGVARTDEAIMDFTAPDGDDAS